MTSIGKASSTPNSFTFLWSRTPRGRISKQQSSRATPRNISLCANLYPAHDLQPELNANCHKSCGTGSSADSFSERVRVEIPRVVMHTSAHSHGTDEEFRALREGVALKLPILDRKPLRHEGHGGPPSQDPLRHSTNVWQPRQIKQCW